MKTIALACVLAFTACASSQKIASGKAEGPVNLVVVKELGDRRVSFTVTGVWAPMSQDESMPELIVLQHLDDPSSAIAIYFQKAEPGTTIEETTAHWMMVMLSGPTVFTATDVSEPEFISLEEATFTISGVDKKTPMISKCRIKLIGDATLDYWAVIFSVSPTIHQEETFAEVDRIAKSLRLEPLDPPR